MAEQFRRAQELWNLKRKISNQAEKLEDALGLRRTFMTFESYRDTDFKFWRRKINKLKKDIKIRDGNKKRALELSKELREPLQISKTSLQNITWTREIRRLRMRARRALAKALPIFKTKFSTIFNDIKGAADKIKKQNKIIKKSKKRLARTLIELKNLPNFAEERKKILREDAEEFALEYSTELRVLPNGTQETEFLHEFDYTNMDTILSNENFPYLIELIRKILEIHELLMMGNRCRMLAQLTKYDDDLEERFDWTVSTPYIMVENDTEDILSQFNSRVLRDQSQNYLNSYLAGLKISILKVPDEIMGASGRSLIEAEKSWLILDPKAAFNCLFQALAVCRNFQNNSKLLEISEEGQRLRVNSAKNLKDEIKQEFEIIENFADNKSIQAASSYTRYPVKLYNNIYENISPLTYLAKKDGKKFWTYDKNDENIIKKNGKATKDRMFIPANPLERYRGSIKFYEILRKNNHCYAMIRKNDLYKIHPSYILPDPKKSKLKAIENNTEDFCKIIKKSGLKHDYNWNVAAWDIETSKDKNQKHIPYKCAIAWPEYKFGEPVTDAEKEFLKLTFDLQYRKEYRAALIKFGIYEGKTFGWVVKNDLEYAMETSKKSKIFQHLTKAPRISMEHKTQQFTGLGCLKEMTKFIYDNKNIFNGFTLYAHNGGKYDLPLAIEKAFLDSDYFRIDGKNCCELNGAWIGFTLVDKNDRTFKINFRDSFRLLSMSLEKVACDLKVKHQKLSETVNHNQISLINYNDSNKINEISKYLENDVLGLLEVVQKFGGDVYKATGIEISKCYTGASLAKKNYFMNYYNGNEQPIYTLTDSQDKFIRDGYFGGRVEAFKLGHAKKLYYMDFTSLYPDVGRKKLPYGKPIIFKIIDEGEPPKLISDYENVKEDAENDWPAPEGICTRLPKDFFGFCSVWVKTKNFKARPKHEIILNNRLTFPIFKTWHKLNLFSEVLDYDIYDYKFIEFHQYKKGRFLKKYFEDGFQNKAKSKADKNLAMAHAYKIIINSGYGFWGLRTKNRDGVIICENGNNEYLDYLNSDRLLGLGSHNDYTFARVLKDLEIKDFNVGIAAAISSYARNKIYDLLKAVDNVGGVVYYCDTDAIITDINIKDFPEIQEKFQWDGTGEELGSLKNEADEKVLKILEKLYPDNKTKQNEILKELIEKENGNLCFDEGVITGCKQYALKKSIEIEGKNYNIEIVKIKGFSQKDEHADNYTHEELNKTKIVNKPKISNKLSFLDMEKMNDGQKISQSQTQFRIPKSNYISESKAFNIHSKKTQKSFRKTYSKGKIFNEWILPHII